MIKAYIKKGTVTLISANKKKASFFAGTEIINVLDNGNKSVYSMFSDFSMPDFKNSVLKELDRIYALSSLSKYELFGAMDKGRKNKLYNGKDFKVSFETIGGEAVWTFSLESVYDLLALEIITAIESGRPLKKCENCGQYFIPSGRSDSVYCERIGKDGYSCKKIGAHTKYRMNSRADDVKKLYDKVTKHNRYLKSKGTIPEREYGRWMDTASSMYTDFKNGRISESALINWLSKDILGTSKRTRSSISDYLL